MAFRIPGFRQKEAAALPGVHPLRKCRARLVRAACSRAGVFFIIVGIAVMALMHTSADPHMRHVSGGWYRDANSYAGTVLKDIYLEGAVHTPRSDAENIMRPYVGKPLLSVPIHEIKKQVEALDWTDIAVVERMFPSAVMIRITEHVPAAIWQNDGIFRVVNAGGEIIQETDDYNNYGPLMLVAGPGAAEHVKPFMEMLGSFPVIAGRTASASFVGERRWDLYLKEGIHVKLPEDAPHAQVAKLDDMVRRGYLQRKPIKTIDMKQGKRIYIELKSGVSEYLSDFSQESP